MCHTQRLTLFPALTLAPIHPHRPALKVEGEVSEAEALLAILVAAILVAGIVAVEAATRHVRREATT